MVTVVTVVTLNIFPQKYTIYNVILENNELLAVTTPVTTVILSGNRRSRQTVGEGDVKPIKSKRDCWFC